MTDCAAPRHHDEPEPAEPSAWLCRHCRLSLSRDLRTIPAWYTAIEDLLDPRRAGDTHGTGDGLPISEPAIDWRSQARHDLEWWVLEVSSASRADRPADARIPALAGWLHAQLRWAIFRSWVPDMAGTFADLRHGAIAVIDPRPPLAFIIPAAQNWCPRCHAPGLLRVLRRSMVACYGCGHVWDSTQLLRLGEVIIRGTGRQAA